MKVEIILFDQAEENPTGEVIDLAFTEHRHLDTETVRSNVQSTAERVVLQEVSLGLLEQPWFWSVALATGAEELELVLVEGESMGWVGESFEAVCFGSLGGAAGSGVGGCLEAPKTVIP